MSAAEGNTVVDTADGSHSIRSSKFAVDYHSTHGALQESRHVFLEAGLRPLLDDLQQELDIFEMGFGTGLNALLVRQEALRFPQTIFRYHTLERYPLPEEQILRLNYPTLLEIPRAQLMDLHQADWGMPVVLDPNFILDKRNGDYLEGCSFWPAGSMDLIFYDAFAPRSQPELWTPAAMEIAYAALRPGGVLTALRGSLNET